MGLRKWMGAFGPLPSGARTAEQVRAALGALVGMVATALLCRLALGSSEALPWLMAPAGASAVLLFAVPASPLAQPWSILVGNSVSALVGVCAARLVPDPALAAGVAVAGAIGAMFVLRCLHPPGGAVAVTAVVGGPAIHALGFGFVLWPVAANSIVLLLGAIAYNNATRRAYPHPRQPLPAKDHATRDLPPAERVGVSAGDVEEALRQHAEIIDVLPGDLQQLVAETENAALHRATGIMRCEVVMSRDVATATPDMPVRDGFARLRRHHVKALPVVDEAGRLVGIVTQADFVRLLDDAAGEPPWPRLRTLLRRERSAGEARIADIMTAPAVSVDADASLFDLVPLMSNRAIHHMPVVSAGRLVGIVTQSDVIAALHAMLVREAMTQRA
jgi:CBS domain-containing membrane protein